MKAGLDVFSSLVDRLNVGVVVIDNNNRIVIFNKIAGEMLQVNPNERIGSSVLRCHGEVSEQNVLKMIDDLKFGRVEKQGGWVNFRGRMLYEHLYAIRDSKGNCIGVVDELHDAAEQAEYLKSQGQWKEIHVSGLGDRAPRTPKP